MNKKILRIAVSGALGKMGQCLIRDIYNTKHISLGAAIVKSNSEFIKEDIGKILNIKKKGVTITDSLEDSLDKFDILIDFTNPKTTLKNLNICSLAKKNAVIGSTGFTDIEHKQINFFSEKISIVKSSNYSIGINLILSLLTQISKIIGKTTDIEIIEKHHNKKIDAPSGTALELGNKICQAMNWNFETSAIYDRKNITKPRNKHDIGFSSIRAGNLIGEHKIIFANAEEHIEITHKAINRSIFSKGAIKAAIWLFKKGYTTGLYNMNNVLNI